MNNGPRTFKKTPLALGLAAVLAASNPAQAVNWDIGDVSISFDSTFSIGTSFRVEDRDFRLISNSNQPNLDWTGYNGITNIVYTGEDIWALNDGVGRYSSNSDLGNLNFDPGKAFSTVFKGTHELDIQYENFGLFVRGFYFYDFELKDGDRAWTNPVSSQLPGFNRPHDPCADDLASDFLCSDIRFLDAFVYADFDIGNVPVQIRIGEQVISWGESTFIQHGINITNPVDVTRARAPGAELKEVFIPVGTIFASLGLTDTIGLSMFYQYEWQQNILPQAGSYFATNDFAGDGGQANNIQLSFTRNPDIDLDFLLASLNNIGDGVRAGVLDSTAAISSITALATKVAIRPFGNDFHNEASDSGQYGIKFSYYAEQLNETEFGFYHINYHSKFPLLNGLAADYRTDVDPVTGNPRGLLQSLAYVSQNQITAQNITDIEAFPESQAFYPEDIKLYGISFNTNIGETSLAGEITHRQDEPLQLDDVELLYTAFPEQLFNAGLRPDLEGISQITEFRGQGVEPGGFVNGIIELDTTQIQLTASHLFGPAFGTDNFILLGEVGYVSISDFPDESVLRLNAPGTDRSASLAPLRDASGNIITTREGLHVGLSNGPEVDAQFATEDAWGYRLLAVADFNNVYSGINLRVRATFAHDVDGTTPDPMFLFTEGRKSSNISFTFDYLSKFSATASYNAFWGGGQANALSDRDFISIDFKYAI